jgi:hypothetical protein
MMPDEAARPDPEINDAVAAGENAGPAPRGVVLGAAAVLTGFILFQAPLVYEEWQALRNDWAKTRLSEPIGFLNISPNPSYALHPDPWVVECRNSCSTGVARAYSWQP